MNASCYFWRWADNDVPGKPTGVHAALLRGDRHPALQPFDARPVLAAIEALAGERPVAERGEWEWLVEPAGRADQASFVFLNCPRPPDFKAMHQLLARHLLGFDVTCFDEGLGMLGDWFPPKLSEFQCGQWPGEMIYDITADDLPVLLKRVRPKVPHPFAVLTNRRAHFVQCFREPSGYVVEWRENDMHDSANFQHWRAQDIQKLAALDVPYTRTGIAPEKSPDRLRYADALKIFQTFLHQQSRPAQYHWININDWLK